MIEEVEEDTAMMISPRVLTPHPYNEKIYGQESIASLKERIATTKWVKPLVVTPNHIIISGHRRWRAALELEIDVPIEYRTFANETDELEALLVENESREKTVEQKVREAEYWRKIETERARKRMSQAAIAQKQGCENFRTPGTSTIRTVNQVAEKVGFGTGRTYEKAATVVATADKLKENGKTDKAQELLDTLNTKSVHKAYQEVKKQVEQEQVAQLQQSQLVAPVAVVEERKVETGQVWRLGKHTLYCGDSASEHFINLAKQSQASFAFADPPYNAGVAEWDTDFLWQHDYLIDVAPIVAVTPGIVSIQSLMRCTSMPYKWSLSYWLNNGMTRGALGFGNWIYVALFSHESLYRNAQDFAQVSISSADRDELEHKGRKPLAMMLHIIKLFTEQGQTVIDPFLGTGTTLAVCQQTERICIGAELNPIYANSIIQRWETQTGCVAEVM